MEKNFINIVGSIVALISTGVFATFLVIFNIKKEEIWDDIRKKIKERR